MKKQVCSIQNPLKKMSTVEWSETMQFLNLIRHPQTDLQNNDSVKAVIQNSNSKFFIKVSQMDKEEDYLRVRKDIEGIQD